MTEQWPNDTHHGDSNYSSTHTWWFILSILARDSIFLDQQKHRANVFISGTIFKKLELARATKNTSRNTVQIYIISGTSSRNTLQIYIFMSGQNDTVLE
jgi:hypothetical protein